MIDKFIEQHEQLGAAVSRIVTEYAASIESRPVASEATPADLVSMFDEEFPGHTDGDADSAVAASANGNGTAGQTSEDKDDLEMPAFLRRERRLFQQ